MLFANLVMGRKVAYSVLVCVLCLAPIFGFIHWGLTFFLTVVVSVGAIATLDFLVHKSLHRMEAPSSFLFHMFFLVLSIHTLFAAIYYLTPTATDYLSDVQNNSISFRDAFYFSGVTLFTVGYGDIVPIGDFRFTATVQIYLGHFLIFTVVAWGLAHFSNRRLSGN